MAHFVSLGSAAHKLLNKSGYAYGTLVEIAHSPRDKEVSLSAVVAEVWMHVFFLGDDNHYGAPTLMDFANCCDMDHAAAYIAEIADKSIAVTASGAFFFLLCVGDVLVRSGSLSPAVDLVNRCRFQYGEGPGRRAWFPMVVLLNVVEEGGSAESDGVTVQYEVRWCNFAHFGRLRVGFV